MTPPKKIQTGIAAVAVVGLTAAGAAVAANKLQGTKSSQQTAAAGSFAAASSSTKSGTDRDHHGGPGFRHDDLADAASYLGITQAALETALQSGKTLAQVADATSGKSAAGLIDALVAAEKAELAAAVKAGDLTQAQADQLTANLKAHETAEVNGTFRGHGPGGPGDRHGGHGHGDGLAAAATYLGITQNALLTQLQSGKTLAQIAEATNGKSTAGLVAALVAAEKTELAAAVKAGDLTQAQADQISSGLQARVTALVNGTRPAHDGPAATTTARTASARPQRAPTSSSPRGGPAALPSARAGPPCNRACRHGPRRAEARDRRQADSVQRRSARRDCGLRATPLRRAHVATDDTARDRRALHGDELVLVGVEHVRIRRARCRARRASRNVRALRDRPRRDDLPARAALDDLPAHRRPQLDVDRDRARRHE